MTLGKETSKNEENIVVEKPMERKTPEELLSIGTDNDTKEIEKLIRGKEIDLQPHLDIQRILKIIEIESQSSIANENLAIFAEQYKIRKTDYSEDLFETMISDVFFQKTLAREISIRLIGKSISLKENKEEALQYIQAEANSIYFNTLSVYASYKDALTMLWSRTAIEKMIDINLEEGKAPIIAYIDLNKFKEINDSYGHPIGDLVLKIFAEAATEVFDTNFRSSDYFGRMSGDEFIAVFVTNGLKTSEERKAFTEKIKETIQRLKNIFIEELIKQKYLKGIENKYIRKNPFSVGIYMGEKATDLERTIMEWTKHRDALIGIADQALLNAKEGKDSSLELGAVPIVIIDQLTEIIK